MANTTDSLLSKMEQVFAMVQGLDLGGVIKTDGKGTYLASYLDNLDKINTY